GRMKCFAFKWAHNMPDADIPSRPACVMTRDDVANRLQTILAKSPYHGPIIHEGGHPPRPDISASSDQDLSWMKVNHQFDPVSDDLNWCKHCGFNGDQHPNCDSVSTDRAPAFRMSNVQHFNEVTDLEPA